jgi:dTDP-L-rhamnose 4-epimerase
MSLYGEGLYPAIGRARTVGERTLEQLKAGRLGIHGEDGGVLQPMPTPETKRPRWLRSMHLSKFDQERCA